MRKKKENKSRENSLLCETHPRYTAKREPRTSCIYCWLAWMDLHPNIAVESRVASLLVKLLLSKIERANSSAQGARQMADASLYVANRR